MNIRPVHTEADYNATLKQISKLMVADPALGTPDGDRLDVLLTLVQAYEVRHYPMDPPDPIQAIRFRMEQQGLTIKDLEPMIGRSNRVYEVLNGERRLTLNMIRRLHEGLGISAEVLIGRDEGCELAI
jgi:HTH-type transcriptional regulator/antitoxin HigA